MQTATANANQMLWMCALRLREQGDNADVQLHRAQFKYSCNSLRRMRLAGGYMKNKQTYDGTTGLGHSV